MADRKLLVFNADIGMAEEQHAEDTAVVGGPVDFGANRLANLPAPQNAQDAATKAYVDARIGSGTGGGGSSGIDGNTILSGSGDPANSVGRDGDYFMSDGDVLFGPKANGTWPSMGVSLVGPRGTPGTAFYSGEGPPDDSQFETGSYYIDRNSGLLYGPKGA